MTDRAPAATPSPAATPVGAGRGLVFITGAKLWFMVAGYVIQFALPRALGSPARFGIWVLVLSLVSPIDNVMVRATIQGVSKFTAESDGRASLVTRAALRMQLFLGGGTALAFFVAAPAIAWFERDPSLTPALRLASGIIVAYAFYAVFIGSANGQRAFHKQAALDATFSTLRTVLVVGAALVTGSAVAAIGGFVGAAAIILIVSFFVIGVGTPSPNSDPFDMRALVAFFSGVAVYLLIVNLLMFVDGLLLKRLVAQAHGNLVANTQEGIYGATQAIARIPYQLILAVTFIIFPLVSRSTFEGDAEKTRGYVEKTMRYSLVATALFAVCLSARPHAMMRFFYPERYVEGGAALAALAAGYVCFSLFIIGGTIINGAGRTLPTVVIGGVTLAVAIGADWLAIHFALLHAADPLRWVAAGTTGAMGLGLVLMVIYLQRSFGASLPLRSVARVAVAAAAAVGVGRLWPHHGFFAGKLMTPVACAAIGAAYLLVAIVTGELDLAGLRRARGKAQAKPQAKY